MPVEYSQGVYNAVVEAGAEFGLVHFGLFATESLRLEKCYRAWKGDLSTEFTPLETALERFVDFEKGDFVGRDALVRQRAEGVSKRFVAMLVENEIASPHQGDPIYSGDELVGVVTSGGYGHTIEKNIALGFVPSGLSAPGTELEISIIGTLSKAVVVTEPIFDPEHERPRAKNGG